MLSACFPTIQSPRIDPGLRLDAAVTVIGDQERNDLQQGTDLVAVVIPAIGLGHRVEIGVPVGVYAEDGFARDGEEIGAESIGATVAPYVKFALLPTTSHHHLALTAQAAFVVPGSIGLTYGRDLGRWEPFVGAAYIFSWGPAGDDPLIPRYQEAGQRMIALSAGAHFAGAAGSVVQAGLLINSYRDGAVYGDFGQPTTRRTLVDLFIGLRVGITR